MAEFEFVPDGAPALKPVCNLSALKKLVSGVKLTGAVFHRDVTHPTTSPKDGCDGKRLLSL